MLRRLFYRRTPMSYRGGGYRRTSVVPYSYGMTVLLVSAGILLVLYLLGYLSL